MQVPSILFLGEFADSLVSYKGVAIGAIASMAIGFSWGGWMLGSTANRHAAEQASTAVVAVLTPICVEKFLQNSGMRKQIWQPCEKSLPTGNRASTWRRAVGRHGRGLRPPTTSWPGRVQRN